MTTKDDVIREHRKHPDWTAPRIAKALNCRDGYVRATAQRQGLTLPKGICVPGNGLLALGRAARAAGLTIEKIEKIARGRAS